VHFAFSVLLFLVIILFNAINDASVVSMIFILASYTYGPLLGLFAFGLLLKNRGVKDKWVPFICLLSPIFTFFISQNSSIFLRNYVFDNELIIVNALFTFVGLLMISKKNKVNG
jgi:hypothetical protein